MGGNVERDFDVIHVAVRKPVSKVQSSAIFLYLCEAVEWNTVSGVKGIDKFLGI